MSKEKTFYYSTSPKRYFLIPEQEVLEKGGFRIQTFDGKTLEVNRKDITAFGISTFEARPFIQQQLDDTVTQFRETFGLGKKEKKEKADQKDTSAEKLYENIIGEKTAFDWSTTSEVLKDFGSAMKTLWQAATTTDEAEVRVAKEKMKDIRQQLEKKGVKVGDKFEELPEILSTKHNQGEPSLQESAEQLKETTEKLKSSIQDVLNAFKLNKEEPNA